MGTAEGPGCACARRINPENANNIIEPNSNGGIRQRLPATPEFGRQFEAWRGVEFTNWDRPGRPSLPKGWRRRNYSPGAAYFEARAQRLIDSPRFGNCRRRIHRWEWRGARGTPAQDASTRKTQIIEPNPKSGIRRANTRIWTLCLRLFLGEPRYPLRRLRRTLKGLPQA
jgi:hypothetical protein